jgi:hypothetical protein
MLNNEQKAFIAAGMGGMDSFGQGYRWGAQNLSDNVFDPQQAGYLLQSGFSNYLSPSDVSAGQQFNYEQSPAQQSARAEDGGLFGLGGLGELAMLAAAVYTGGAALGAWGGAGAAAGTTASGMLAAESAALLEAGFTASEIAGSLAGLGNAAEIGSVLTAAGIPASTAATLAGEALASGGNMLTGAGTTAGSAFPSFPSIPTDSGMLSGIGGTPYNPATASLNDIISAVSASGGNAIPASALTPELAAAAASGATVASLSPSLLSQLASTISNATGTTVTGSQLLSGGASLLGGLLSGNAASGAAQTNANAQLEAARIAADAAKFRPVGVTTRFGQSQFQKDANGNVIGAGYNLSPDVKAQQDQLMAASGGMLNQFTGSQAATAPMGQAAQTMFGLGNNYLSTTPQQQAAKYMADQQALLATGRERDLTSLENRLLSQGRLGLATGGTSTGMMAANPEMEALRNAQKQQDLALAAQATQGGMDYARFGAGMVGSGGQMLRDQYGTQTAAYDPYKTAMGGAHYLEGLGQQPLTLGMDIGRQVTSGSAASGSLLAQGMQNAATTMQPANAFSPWGSLLAGGANMMNNYANQQQQQNQTMTIDPATGKVTVGWK